MSQGTSPNLYPSPSFPPPSSPLLGSPGLPSSLCCSPWITANRQRDPEVEEQGREKGNLTPVSPRLSRAGARRVWGPCELRFSNLPDDECHLVMNLVLLALSPKSPIQGSRGGQGLGSAPTCSSLSLQASSRATESGSSTATTVPRPRAAVSNFSGFLLPPWAWSAGGLQCQHLAQRLARSRDEHTLGRDSSC